LAHAQDQGGADKHSLDHSDRGKGDNGGEGAGQKHSSDHSDRGKDDNGREGAGQKHSSDRADHGKNGIGQMVRQETRPGIQGRERREGDQLGNSGDGEDSPAQSRGDGGSRPGDLRAEADTAEADIAEVKVAAPEDAPPDAAAAGTSLGAASLNPSAVFLVFLVRSAAPSVGGNAIPAEGQFAPPVGGLAAPSEYQAGRWGPLASVPSAGLQATDDPALMDFAPGGLDVPADLLPDLFQPRADAPESLREQLFDWASSDSGRAWLPWVAGLTLSALALEIARRQMKRAKGDDPFLSPDFALVGWPPQAGGTERGWS
jgi:hypothetical protein